MRLSYLGIQEAVCVVAQTVIDALSHTDGSHMHHSPVSMHRHTCCIIGLDSYDLDVRSQSFNICSDTFVLIPQR
jgi:hypothetical protein